MAVGLNLSRFSVMNHKIANKSTIASLVPRWLARAMAWAKDYTLQLQVIEMIESPGL